MPVCIEDELRLGSMTEPVKVKCHVCKNPMSCGIPRQWSDLQWSVDCNCCWKTTSFFDSLEDAVNAWLDQNPDETVEIKTND